MLFDASSRELTLGGHYAIARAFRTGKCTADDIRFDLTPHTGVEYTNQSLATSFRDLAKAYGGSLVRLKFDALRKPYLQPTPGAEPPAWSGDSAMLERFEVMGDSDEFMLRSGLSPSRPPVRVQAPEPESKTDIASRHLQAANFAHLVRELDAGKTRVTVRCVDGRVLTFRGSSLVRDPSGLVKLPCSHFADGVNFDVLVPLSMVAKFE